MKLRTPKPALWSIHSPGKVWAGLQCLQLESERNRLSLNRALPLGRLSKVIMLLSVASMSKVMSITASRLVMVQGIQGNIINPKYYI